MTIYDELAAPFPPDAISWRVGSTNADKTKGMALAYIDARDAQDRLNAVCGPFGWQCRHEVSGDKRVTCHVGVRDPATGEWVWKSDGAGETDYEGEKGSYSDSFKRACVKWGVGRYLYDLDSPWVAVEQRGKTFVLPEGSQRTLRDKLVKWQAAHASGNLPNRAEIKSPIADAWDVLDEASKAFMLKLAAEVKARLRNDPSDAFDYIEGQQLDTDEKAALWTRFESSERTALTKAAKARNPK